MITDTDKIVNSRGQAAVKQINILREAAETIKEYSEMNYMSRVTEQIYNLKTKTPVNYLETFYVNPIIPIFVINVMNFLK